MVKTVELTGTELAVSDLGGQNAAVKNLGSAAIYASIRPNVVAGADDVVEIPAGGGEVVLDANGTVYLLGEGKAQCTGTPYATPNFKMPSSSTSGGGGGKSQGIICGTAELASRGIKSILIGTLENPNYVEKAFAAALAAETGWELQPDGVSVLNDGVGFRFIYSTLHYVCLVNDVKNGNSNYLDNFQYLEHTGYPYYMDICYGPNGAVAFGFRLGGEDPKLTFIMTRDGNGDSVCMATYYNGFQLAWVKSGETSMHKIKDNTLRAGGASGSMLGLFELADGYSGGTLSDCFCIYWWPDNTYLIASLLSPGKVVSINGKRFAIIYNHMYTDIKQIWLAMPVAEGGGV